MPILNNAKKALRQNIKRTQANTGKKSILKTKILALKKNKSQESLRTTSALIDKMAKAGIIHKNKASRLKSRIARMVNQAQETKKSVTKKANK